MMHWFNLTQKEITSTIIHCYWDPDEEGLNVVPVDYDKLSAEHPPHSKALPSNKPLLC